MTPAQESDVVPDRNFVAPLVPALVPATGEENGDLRGTGRQPFVPDVSRIL